MPSHPPTQVRILLLLIFGPVLRVPTRIPSGGVRIYAGVLVGVVEGICHISVFRNDLISNLDIMTTNISPECGSSSRETNAFSKTHLDSWKLRFPGL